MVARWLLQIQPARPHPQSRKETDVDPKDLLTHIFSLLGNKYFPVSCFGRIWVPRSVLGYHGSMGLP